MTGSGGGNFGGHDGFGSSGNCEDLVVETQLSSPKPSVVSTISAGDKLSVKLNNAGSSTIVEVEYKGQTAGGLASPNIQRLRECLDAGFSYEATVLSVKSGQVVVRVTALP